MGRDAVLRVHVGFHCPGRAAARPYLGSSYLQVGSKAPHIAPANPKKLVQQHRFCSFDPYDKTSCTTLCGAAFPASISATGSRNTNAVPSPRRDWTSMVPEC